MDGDKLNINCNFYEQYITQVRNDLEAIGYDHSNLSNKDCLVTWFDWKIRIVNPGIRTIKKSDTFNCLTHLELGLSKLEKAFKTNEAIWPWQSKRIEDVQYLDGLFADWGILHFHLGTDLKTDGYIDRTGRLLYAIVTQNTVYEIGIYSHNDWYEYDILNIVERNWPDLLGPYILKDVIDVLNPISSREDVKSSRIAKINRAIKLNSGRIVFSPGGGITLGNTSVKASLHAINISKEMREWEKIVSSDITTLVNNGKLEDKDYNITLKVDTNGVVATDGNLYNLRLK